MDFVANTIANQEEMLRQIGVKGVSDLFFDIPQKAMLKRKLAIPKPLSEQELMEEMASLAARNKALKSLAGAGAYHHYVPEAVNHIILRSEFLTSYTPYQAELSQGMLQAIYEYQSMICELTGMDAANASMYEGASASAEAMIMAASITGKREVVVSRTLHPEYRAVISTYAKSRGLAVKEVGHKDGVTSPAELEAALTAQAACAIIQSPNFFGQIEPLDKAGKIIHGKGALFIAVVNEPTSLGLLKPPGELGADIVAGEGQSFGAGLSFGGPYLGIIATKANFIRYLPGRLSGATTDTDGKRGFVLTLQAREQHIRREKALSNICTNEGLIMLAAAVYLAMLGKELATLANVNLQRAHYFSSELEKAGIRTAFRGPFYNEFVAKPKDPEAFQKKLLDNGFVPGIDLGAHYPELAGHVLLCATEMVKREDIDRAVACLRS